MQGEHGVHTPFEKIVQEEGGETSPAAVKAATLYAMKALAMGGEWIRYNVMTERTDILCLQYSRRSQVGTTAKAACETPVLLVQIKDSKQQPTAAGTSKRARESILGPKAKKPRVETPDKLGTTNSLQ